LIDFFSAKNIAYYIPNVVMVTGKRNEKRSS